MTARRNGSWLWVALAVLWPALALEPMLSLDAWVLRWLTAHRTCAWSGSAPSIDHAVRLVAGAFAVAAIVRARSRGRLDVVVRVAVLVATGLLAGEALKTVFERMRPNQSPGGLSGNAFPSGHVMNTTLFFVGFSLIARETGWSRRARVLLWSAGGVCILAQGGYRMINGSHWPSDVVGSALLGLAWLAGGSRPRGTALAAVGLLGLASLAMAGWRPVFRVDLPSALDRSGEPITRIELGEPRPELRGRWSHGWREPVGGVSWAVSPVVAISFAAGSGSAEQWIRLTLRPPGQPEEASGCLRVRVSVNDWDAGTFTLLEGWREYHFVPPGGVLRPNGNRLRIRALDEPDGGGGEAPGRLAVHDLRVEPEPF